MSQQYVTPDDLSRHGEALIESIDEMHARQMQDLERVIAKGIETGLRAILDDPKLTDSFWASGFDRLSGHAGDGASKWLGKRLLTMFLFAAVGLGVTWLVKIGAVK